jgi:hypothetical protein
MFYLIYLGLKHGVAIEQLIIELKGGVKWLLIIIGLMNK